MLWGFSGSLGHASRSLLSRHLAHSGFVTLARAGAGRSACQTSRQRSVGRFADRRIPDRLNGKRDRGAHSRRPEAGEARNAHYDVLLSDETEEDAVRAVRCDAREDESNGVFRDGQLGNDEWNGELRDEAAALRAGFRLVPPI